MNGPPGAGLVRGMAWLVPADCRREWRREWEAELAYAHHRGVRAGRIRLRAVGAVAHAAWLRYDRWRWEMLWHDVVVASRTLVKRPGFLVIAVLTLALGIGANAAMFSAARAVLLRPLPFASPDGIVSVATTTLDRPDVLAGSSSPPDFTDWRRDVTAFREMAASVAGASALTGEGGAEQVPSAQVTGGFFTVLGVVPELGRVIQPEDDPPGSPDVAVLGHGLWARRFGARQDIVGAIIAVDGRPTRIVGVMPEGFSYPLGSEFWQPLRFSDEELRTQRGAMYLDVIARLAPGTTVAAAEEALRAYARRLAERYPDPNARRTVRLHVLRDAIIGDVRPAMRLLLGAVGFVFLIVCVNVANLVLTRGLGRRRELSVRTALGASRGRLVRSLVVESALLAGAGGAAGLLLGHWAAAALAGLDRGIGIPLLDQTRVDGAVVGFVTALSALAAMLAGLLPAWHASRRMDLVGGLREESGTTTGDRSRQRVRAALIVAETTLAVALLVGAGLLVRTVVSLARVDLGLDTARVLTFNVTLPEARYPTPDSRADMVARLVDRIAGHPEVVAAGAVFGLPLTNFGYNISTSTLDGRRLERDEQMARLMQVRLVTPDYFRAMGIAMRAGRGVTAADGRGAPPVVVLNEAAAAKLWPGENPLGHTVTLGTRLGQGGPPAGGTVVGVAADVRDGGPSRPTRPTVFLSHAQFPMDFVTLAVKAGDDPGRLIAPLRRAVADLDPDVPIFRVRTLEQLAGDAVARPRLFLTLLGLFALAAVALAALGIYGVLAHTVGQRTREIGVRMALGADAGRVMRLVIGQTLVLAGSGLVLGLALATFASRLMGGLLFGVEPVDLPTYGAVAAGFTVVSAAASALPARRAATVDPVTALRGE